MSYIKAPMDIEKRSFEIIEEELGEKINNFTEAEKPVVKRIIHTTADFEYADLLDIKNDAINNIIAFSLVISSNSLTSFLGLVKNPITLPTRNPKTKVPIVVHTFFIFLIVFIYIFLLLYVTP